MFLSSPAWSARIGAARSRPRGSSARATPFRSTGLPVEADRAREAVPARRREPRVATAEAEADGEDRACRTRAACARSADVGLDPLRRRLLRRGPCTETRRRACRRRRCARSSRTRRRRCRARRSAARAPRRTGRGRGRPAGSRRPFRPARPAVAAKAAKRLPSAASSDEVVVRDRRARDDRDRRQRVELEAHGVKIRECRGSGDAVQDAVRERAGGVAVTVMPH